MICNLQVQETYKPILNGLNNINGILSRNKNKSCGTLFVCLISDFIFLP